MDSNIVEQGWVVRIRRFGPVSSQEWCYLCIRERHQEAKATELQGFIAEDPQSRSAWEIFDWVQPHSIDVILTDTMITPSNLDVNASIPLLSTEKPPKNIPPDLHWLRLSVSRTGTSPISVAFGCPLPQAIGVLKGLLKLGVSWGRKEPQKPPIITAYCDKRGGGTSVFGSVAYKRRYFVVQAGHDNNG